MKEKKKHPYLICSLISLCLIIVGCCISQEDLMALFILLGLFGLTFGNIIILSIKISKKTKKDVAKEKHKDLDDNWNVVIKNKFATNEEQQKVLVNGNEYSFSDILDAELLEDDNSVVKSSLLGTAAKGFLFGAPGMLSSAKHTKKFCEKLEIKITIKSLSNPLETIKIISYRTAKSGMLYKELYEKAQKCLAIIKVIIDMEKQNI